MTTLYSDYVHGVEGERKQAAKKQEEEQWKDVQSRSKGVQCTVKVSVSDITLYYQFIHSHNMTIQSCMLEFIAGSMVKINIYVICQPCQNMYSQ